ncbi:hypothetical protein I3843_05G036500 [Carya illinoinensis]|nr:hypothetical protein I3843_05G036500 [Carya illinoinensis]
MRPHSRKTFDSHTHLSHISNLFFYQKATDFPISCADFFFLLNTCSLAAYPSSMPNSDPPLRTFISELPLNLRYPVKVKVGFEMGQEARAGVLTFKGRKE